VAFHQHVQAGVFQQKILQSPACVKGRGLSGEFVMDTPEQNELPLSVTTMVGPAGARSFVVTKGPDLFGADVIYDVANTFNEQAKKLVSKIIADCTSLAI
jgi:hypothetical protein